MANHQQSNTPKESAKDTGGKLMKWGMMACCVVMFIPIGTYFLAGGTVSGMTESLGLFAPLLLCVGAHFFLHKAMGKSCHSKGEKKQQNEPKAAEVEQPALARQ